MRKLALALITALLPIPIQAETLIYFGTDTGDASKGVYVSTVDQTSVGSRRPGWLWQ